MKKKYILANIVLCSISIIFLVLVKTIDVQCTAVNNSCIGFSTINQFLFNKLGSNMTWYHITDALGLIAIMIAGLYGIIGLIELIKRKNIKKVDKEIIILGIFYFIVILLYILFEKFIVNYRPILIDDVLEASFPSSHTLMILCICGSSIIINNRLFKNKYTKILNYILVLIIVITIFGRLISGVHWFTDIIGGIIFSSALLLTFFNFINIKKRD